MPTVPPSITQFFTMFNVPMMASTPVWLAFRRTLSTIFCALFARSSIPAYEQILVRRQFAEPRGDSSRRFQAKSELLSQGECAWPLWCPLQSRYAPPAETSARTILVAAGVTAPGCGPAGALRRKAVRLPSKAYLARHRERSALATVRLDGPQAGAAQPAARNGVRVGPRSLPAAGRRKVALEPSTNPDRSSAPPSIGRRVATTRCPNKHALLPALPPGVRAVAPVDRNWPVEIGATALSPGALSVALPLR